MPVAHVFISYKSEDKDFAFELNQQLKDAGFETWIDKEYLRAGEDWREEIDKAIDEAFALVLVVTPEASKSRYMIYELAYAWALDITVIPIMLRGIELRSFHPRLEGRQHEDFRINRPWGKLFNLLRDIEDRFQTSIPIPRFAPPAVKHAIRALDSLVSEERILAIENLAQMNHLSASNALLGALHHPTRDVRINAALTIAKQHELATEDMIPPLFEGMKMLRYGRDSEAVERRKEIAIALVYVADYCEITNIKAFIGGIREYLDDPNVDVRVAMTLALWDIGDDTIIPDMVKLLSDTAKSDDWGDKVCDVAMTILERLNTPKALEAIEKWKVTERQILPPTT